MKALFGRKMVDMDTLKYMTSQLKEKGVTGSPYVVTKEIVLNDQDFKEFINDLLEDQPWIDKSDGGVNEKGEIRCIRVINLLTGERILVNNERFEYPRYTAIED